MKTFISLSILATCMAFGAQTASADTTFQPHCFEIAAPITCVAGNLEIQVHNRDCFHPTITAQIAVNGQALDTLDNINSQVEGTPAQPNGIAPFVVYSGNGFMLRIVNGLTSNEGAALEVALPSGQKFAEENITCQF